VDPFGSRGFIRDESFDYHVKSPGFFSRNAHLYRNDELVATRRLAKWIFFGEPTYYVHVDNLPFEILAFWIWRQYDLHDYDNNG